MTWSLPKTCFSCQHYKQIGFKEDELAPTKDRWGFDSPAKKQRYGMCDKKGCHVFWNERPCPSYAKELDVTTHDCKPRDRALQSHQDTLF